MKRISRDQAEELFLESEVVDTEIKQDKSELRVIMTLASHHSCHIIYNFKSKEKTYHLDESDSISANIPIL